MAQLPVYQQANLQVTQPGGGQGDVGLMAAAQSKSSLAQRLSSFSDQITGISKSMAQTQAAKDAVVDIQTRKAKVADIRAKGLPFEQEQAEIDKITEGADRIGFGAYSKAYESSALSAYSNQITVDSQVASDLAMINSGGDPDTFLSMFRQFSNETVRSAPTVHTSFVAQNALLAKGSAGYKSLMLAKMSSGSKANKKSYTDSFDALSKQFSDAYYVNDIIGINQIMNQVNAQGQAAVRDGMISQPEFETSITHLANRAMIDAEKRKFGEDLNVGRGDLAYQQFIINERKGFYASADPDEISKMKSSMLNQIKEFNDGTLERDRFEKEQAALISDDTFRQSLQDIAQGRLSEADITTYEQQGVISKSNADQLRERLSYGETRKFSDKNTLSRYAEATTLVDTEPYMIMNDVTLSVEDQNALVAKREQLLETRFKWSRTDDGREAIRRIKEEFGIREGTLMAKIDLDNVINREYNDLYKKFYAEVTASPNPDMDVLGIADNLISEYSDRKRAEAEAQQEKIMQRAIEEAKRRKAEDDDGIPWPWKREKPLEYYMTEK